jgi:hypothetical protein
LATSVGGMRFSCWVLDSAMDALLLVQTRFIKLLGDDNLHRWVNELKRKHYEQKYRMCYK